MFVLQSFFSMETRKTPLDLCSNFYFKIQFILFKKVQRRHPQSCPTKLLKVQDVFQRAVNTGPLFRHEDTEQKPAKKSMTQ